MRAKSIEGPAFGNWFRAGPLSWERVTRIELALSAWEADVLPLNYTRGSRADGGEGDPAGQGLENDERQPEQRHLGRVKKHQAVDGEDIDHGRGQRQQDMEQGQVREAVPAEPPGLATLNHRAPVLPHRLH